jgi:hypothetical protein
VSSRFDIQSSRIEISPSQGGFSPSRWEQLSCRKDPLPFLGAFLSSRFDIAPSPLHHPSCPLGFFPLRGGFSLCRSEKDLAVSLKTSFRHDSSRARCIFPSSGIDAFRTWRPSVLHRGVFESAQRDIATSRWDVVAYTVESSPAACEVVPAGVNVAS